MPSYKTIVNRRDVIFHVREAQKWHLSWVGEQLLHFFVSFVVIKL